MKTVIVRYQTRPECADENAALIARVFEALAQEKPAGLHYQVLREPAGTGFVHIASMADRGEGHPLRKLEAFRQFTAGVAGRCVEQPVTLDMDVLGAYRSGE